MDLGGWVERRWFKTFSRLVDDKRGNKHKAAAETAPTELTVTTDRTHLWSAADDDGMQDMPATVTRG